MTSKFTNLPWPAPAPTARKARPARPADHGTDSSARRPEESKKATTAS
ncbi:hypothetical protein [Streptomyces anulatus]|nr:hypothetical protein [Streptomyces anulatus]